MPASASQNGSVVHAVQDECPRTVPFLGHRGEPACCCAIMIELPKKLPNSTRSMYAQPE